MKKFLRFVDKELEQEFKSQSYSFHKLSLKLVIQLSFIFLASLFILNPLETELADIKAVIPFIFLELTLFASSLLVWKLPLKYCSRAILLVVMSLSLATTEFFIFLMIEKSSLSSVMAGVLVLKTNIYCFLILFSKINWINSLIMILILHCYDMIRVSFSPESFKFSTFIRLVISSFVLHGFLVFLYTFRIEREDRQQFLKSYLNKKHALVSEELLKDVIPSAILVLKEDKVVFMNKNAKKILGVKSEDDALNFLELISIKRKICIYDFISNSFFPESASSRQSYLNLGELAKDLTYHLTNQAFDIQEQFNTFEGESKKVDCQKFFSIQIGSILWHGSKSVMVLINDITQIRRHYKSLNIYKDNLLATISHNLRTPLNGILGILETVSSEMIGMPTKENFDIALVSAKLLLNTINDIIDFSLFSKGKLRLTIEPTNITMLVDDTVKILSIQAKNKGLGLKIDNQIKDKSEKHKIDPNRLRQVLLNLIGNAIKYTNFGKIILRIREEHPDLHIHDPPTIEGKLLNTRKSIFARDPKDPVSLRYPITDKKILLFEVEDTGIGIQPSDSKHLFKMFSRLNSRQIIDTGGVGLGLSVSQSLVTLMNCYRLGGEITLQSELGKGSKFTFPLITENDLEHDSLNEMDVDFPSLPETKVPKQKPFHDSFRMNSDQFSEGDLLVNEPKQNANATNVLIVDDDQINILVASNYLKSSETFEFVFHTAFNGKEAIDLVLRKAKEGHFFDVILMDCNMPIMDGYEASKALKAMMLNKVIPWAPIIAITANVGSADKDKCYSFGMDMHLSKPLLKGILIQSIRDALGKTKSTSFINLSNKK